MALLSVQDLGISFGGLRAVDSFGISMEPKQLYGLIGPNGAGKTTVFNLLTGVYRPDHGTYQLNGENMIGKTPIEISKSGVARTFQNIRLFTKLSVADNVKAALYNQYRYGLVATVLHLPSYKRAEERIAERATQTLKVFGLERYENVRSANLPYGKQRKLEIARALATDPKILLLDEPAAGMNPAETQELMETIRFVRDTYDCSILLIEHDMKVVMGICERITVLDFGKVIASASAEEIKMNPQVISAYLGQEE